MPAHPAPGGRRAGPAPTAAGGCRPPPTRRQRKPVVLLRPVPGRSVIHDLWAGTKLIVVAGIGVLLTFYPGWVPIGLVAALVLTAAWLARIPRGTLPSIPRWLWVLLFLGGLTATFAGGSPSSIWDRSRSASAVCSTSCGSPRCRSCCWARRDGVVDHQCRRNRPPVATLGRPLRPLRVPIDDWAVAVALALRAFPMLIDEFRVLYAARRLRPKERPPTRGVASPLVAGGCRLLAAAITVALRRADEMGDAITARGGAGQISAAPSRPKRRRLGGTFGGRRGVRRGAGAGTHGAGTS